MMDAPTRRLDRFSDPEAEFCPKCGNLRIRAVAWVVGMGQVLLVREIHFGGPQLSTSCRAMVCTECGFTEWYATDPKNLLKT